MTCLQRHIPFALVLAACSSAEQVPENTPEIDGANLPPVFDSVPQTVRTLPGIPVSLEVTVSDPNGDAIEVSWQADGSFEAASGESNSYRAPESDGDSIVITATDAAGASTTASVDVEIADPEQYRDPAIVASTEGNSKSPVIMALDGRLHVMWHDFSVDPSGLMYGQLTADGWQTESLELHPDKAIFAQLVAGDHELHLLWETIADDVGPTEDYAIRHARLGPDGWTSAAHVGNGKRISAAIDSQGQLHAAFFRQKRPVHFTLQDDAWQEGPSIPVEDEYVSTFRSSLVGGAGVLELAVATSPGDISYDVRTTRFEGGSWSSLQNQYASLFLSSDEPVGARDSNGQVHWAWTEQSSVDEWIIGIVEKTDADQDVRWVSAEEGFAINPAIAIPADDRPVTAWSTPEMSIGLSRSPYDAIVDIGGTKAFGPSLTVDHEGFVHLVFYAEDDNKVEQIWYTTNRPVAW